MTNASTFEKLKALNCSAMADEFQNQLNDSKSYNPLGFEERLGFLVDAEWNMRQANKLKNLIKRAAFSVSLACIEDICILRSPADSDAFQSGRYAEHNGRSKTLDFIV